VFDHNDCVGAEAFQFNDIALITDGLNDREFSCISLSEQLAINECIKICI